MSASEPAALCTSSTPGPTIEWLEPKLPDILKNGSSSLGSFTAGEGLLEGGQLELSSPESCSFSGVRQKKALTWFDGPRRSLKLLERSQEQEDIDGEDEAVDSLPDKEEDLGAVEEERSVILHLLSQLKLGMDLTRVGQVPPEHRNTTLNPCTSDC